mgnify:CR=1 FL=1
MSLEGMTENDLVARLKAGDEVAFAGLYYRHMPAMIGVAADIVAGRAAAEEVAQDAWLAVLKNISGFRQQSSLAGWIFTILMNKARTRARRDGRAVSFDEFDDDGLAAAFDGHGRWREVPELREEITPERIVAGRALAAHLQAAIDDLPEAQRAVVVLRIQKGLDAAQVCRILNISDGNMRVLLHRARHALRERISELV